MYIYLQKIKIIIPQAPNSWQPSKISTISNSIQFNWTQLSSLKVSGSSQQLPSEWVWGLLSAWRHWVKYGLLSKSVLYNAVMYSYYSLLLFFNICCYIRTCSQLYSLVMRSFALVCVVRRRKSVLCLPFAVDFNSFCLPSHSLTFSLYFCCNNGIFVNNFLCTACVEYYLIATLA